MTRWPEPCIFNAVFTLSGSLLLQVVCLPDGGTEIAQYQERQVVVTCEADEGCV